MNRLHHLFKNSPSGITFLDEQGRFTDVNDRYCQLLGFSKQELKDRELKDFVHPDDRHKINDLVRRINEHQICTYTDTKRYITKTKSVVWGQENISILYDQDRDCYYAIEIVTDITENRSTSERLEKALAELQERNLELDQFVYRTSHDLRSPLTTILGLINIMKIEKDQEGLGQYISLVENRVLKLDNFLTLMLNYLKNTRLEVKNEPIDFEQLIIDCLQELEYIKGYNKLSIKWEINQGTPLFSDPLRLKIIFQNIISNAIKYQKPNEGNSYLHITVTVTVQQCEVIFKDNGIGINKEHLDNLGSMFFRASEKSDGSGLGMYIVKQAVDRLQGSIQFESFINKGFTILLHFPNPALDAK